MALVAAATVAAGTVGAAWLAAAGGMRAPGAGDLVAEPVPGAGAPARVAVAPGAVFTLEPATRVLRGFSAMTGAPLGPQARPGAAGDLAADLAATSAAVWVALRRDGAGLLVRVPREGGGGARVVAVPGLPPERVVAGPGVVWVLGSGRVASVPVGGRGAGRAWRRAVPGALALAWGYGSVWVLARERTGRGPGASLVLRLDPEDGRVVGRRRAPGAGTAIAVGGGRLWVGNGCPGGWLSAPVGPGPSRCGASARGVADVAAGPGATWAADADGRAVLRLGVRRASERVRLPVRPEAVAAGAGSAWAVSRRGGLYRVGPPGSSPDPARR